MMLPVRGANNMASHPQRLGRVLRMVVFETSCSAAPCLPYLELDFYNIHKPLST